jgi:hypothetical protein
MYGGQKRCIQGFGGEKDQDIDGRIILRRNSRKWDGSMNWIDTAQDRDRWQALVNEVMNLWFP